MVYYRARNVTEGLGLEERRWIESSLVGSAVCLIGIACRRLRQRDSGVR